MIHLHDKQFYSDETHKYFNQKRSQRNIPSESLEVLYRTVPMSTRYTKFHAVDAPAKAYADYPIYNIQNTFNPGNDKGPWSGFVTHVDTESSLRNQFFALQKCDQGKYIPDSKSDLYKVDVPIEQNPMNHPYLFQTSTLGRTSHTEINPAVNMFHNHTREQRNDI